MLAIRIHSPYGLPTTCLGLFHDRKEKEALFQPSLSILVEDSNLRLLNLQIIYKDEYTDYQTCQHGILHLVIRNETVSGFFGIHLKVQIIFFHRTSSQASSPPSPSLVTTISSSSLESPSPCWWRCGCIRGFPGWSGAWRRRKTA